MKPVRILLAALTLLFLAGQAVAQTYPPLTGRVVDQAELLTPEQEQALTLRLEALERESSRQLVVATVQSLENIPLEAYANGLFREWQLGQATANNGALLLVAPNERKVRVEVGYGLEAILTDAFSGQLIRARILPSFRQGDYAAGIAAGVDGLIEQLQAPPEAAEQRVRDAAASEVPATAENSDSFVPMLVWIFVIGLIVLPAVVGVGRRRYGRRYESDALGVAGQILLWTFLHGMSRGGGRSSGGWSSGGGGWSGSGGGFSGRGGGFSGGGGSSGGGGASGSW